MFDDVLVCVFSPEVDDLEEILFLFDLFGFLELLAVKSRACASDSEGHFFVTAIANDDVKSVIKLLNFIGNTEDIDCFGLARLEHVVTLDDLPDRFLLFGERGVILMLSFQVSRTGFERKSNSLRSSSTIGPVESAYIVSITGMWWPSSLI